MQTTTPSWLKINEENFKDLLEYLCKNAKKQDSDPFYAAAKELLKERVNKLIPELASDLSGDNDDLVFRTRLLGAWLLSFPDLCPERTEVFFCMANCLCQIVPDEAAQNLFMTSLRALSSEGVQSLGIAWDDLMDVNAEILAHKLINLTKLGNPRRKEVFYEGKGLVRINNEGISVIPTNKREYKLNKGKFGNCLPMAEDKLFVTVDKDLKIKQSDSSEIDRIREFTKDIRSQQRKTMPSERIEKTYTENQEVVVRIVDVNSSKIEVETTDPNYRKVRGVFQHKNGLFNYKVNDLAKAFRPGDYVTARINNVAGGKFSIYDKMLETILSLVEVDTSYPAEYVQATTNGHLWITTDGVPVITSVIGNMLLHDRAFICIDSIAANGYIAGSIAFDQEGIEECEFDDSKVWLLQTYFRIDNYFVPELEESWSPGANLINILERSVYNYNNTLTLASDSFKVLSFCEMLSEVTEDERELHYLEVKAAYLEQLVLFAKGKYESMVAILPSEDIKDEPSIKRPVDIVKVLKEIGKSADSPVLSEVIESTHDDLTKKIARILQSYNSVCDVVPVKMLQELKMEITRLLSVDGECMASFDDDDNFLGMEDKVKEFKTSFVFPPNNQMKANMKVQSLAVYRAICAFLNSVVGGTLYLGVNDSGYVSGIQCDLEEMKCNLDKYIRTIQDQTKKVFDKSIIDYLDFEVMFDEKVVAIKVKPFDDGVVCLEGVPYKRNFAESVVMRDDEKQRLIATKVVTGINTGNKIGTIDQAIKEKKRVILRHYSSSSRIGDRKIEPFKTFNNGRSVWGYDVEEGCNKQYSISRAAGVDLIQDSWAYESKHEALETDVFRWSGKKRMHIDLELDLTAKNILLDEFPDAEKDINKADTEGQRWILSTDIFDCTAPCRFYLGLAEHIEILKGPELKKAVQDYIENNFSRN